MIDGKTLAIIASYGFSLSSLLGYLLFIYLNGKRLRKVYDTLFATSAKDLRG